MTTQTPRGRTPPRGCRFAADQRRTDERGLVFRLRRLMLSLLSSPAKAGDPVTTSQGLLDAPLSPEVGLGRLRQLLSERNRKHPISPEVGLGRLRQLLSERNRKH